MVKTCGSDDNVDAVSLGAGRRKRSLSGDDDQTAKVQIDAHTDGHTENTNTQAEKADIPEGDSRVNDSTASLLLSAILSRPKRSRPDFCSVDINAREVINWIPSPNRQLTPASSREVRKEAHRLIRETFPNNRSSIDPPDQTHRGGTLSQNRLVRIDLQGVFPRDGQQIANLQIQENTGRQRSPSIAHVEIPTGQDFVTGRFIRRAFEVSLDNCETITLTRRGQESRRRRPG